MTMLKRALLGVACSWLFAFTLGLVFVISAFGRDAFTLPAVLPVEALITSFIALLFAPLAIWAAKTGARNLMLYGPILWTVLAVHIVVGVKYHFGGITQTSLFVLSVAGLIVLGVIPPHRGAEKLK